MRLSLQSSAQFIGESTFYDNMMVTDRIIEDVFWIIKIQGKLRSAQVFVRRSYNRDGFFDEESVKFLAAPFKDSINL